MFKPSPLYSVLNYPGAHVLRGIRTTDSGNVADVQLIGAPLPFSVPVAQLQHFDHSAALPANRDPITQLAQEAVLVYGLEPGRVQRAAELARDPYAIQNARFDELGEPIQPSLKVQCVKGSKGWYVVRPNFCQCEDNRRGHTCKHRIATWMHRESIIRPLAKARRRDKAVILAELGVS